MTTDTDMKIDYALVLKQLQRELDGIEARRAALEAAIPGLKRLVRAEEQLDLIDLQIEHVTLRQNGKPNVPPEFFKGKTPTEAYRDFKKLWGSDFRPPQIVDAFQVGGMEMTRAKMLPALHSVLKRERDKEAREAKKKR